MERDLVLGAIVSAWIVLLFIAFQPGLMSPDSITQYGQGLAGHFTNDHPAFLSWMHGLFGRTVGSPWPMLLLQLMGVGGGMALLVRKSRPSRWRWAVALLVFFLLVPPIWSIAVTLWKDVTMAAALLLSVGAFAYRRPAWALPGLLLAALVRYNAAAAIVPLAIAGTSQLPWLSAVRWRRAVAVVAVLAIAGAAPSIVDRAVAATKLCMVCQLEVMDLAGIYVERPELAAESIFAERMKASDYAAVYSPYNVVPLFNRTPPLDAPRFDLAEMEPYRAGLRAEWLRVVGGNPGLYLKNRLRLYQRFIGASFEPTFYAFNVGITPNPWGFHLRTNILLYRGLRWVQEAARNGPAFRGCFWLLACGAVTFAAWRRRRERMLAFWVGVSGLAYAATYLVIGLSCDFRYLYWTLIATFASAALQLMPPPQPPEASP